MNLKWPWDSPGLAWYEAEYARTGRSVCKEFRCKQNIEEGGIRIGIGLPQSDHGGTNFGWYHPSCLWRTFEYRTNANKRITKIGDIKGFRDLEEEDQEEIKKLIKQGVPRDVPPPANESKPLSGKVSIVRDGGAFLVTGDTFGAKDELKRRGGRWDGAVKGWRFEAANAESQRAVCEFLGIADPTTVGAAPKRIDLATLGAKRPAEPAAAGDSAERPTKARRTDASSGTATASNDAAPAAVATPADPRHFNETKLALASLSVSVLEHLCKARGVPHSGTKAAKIQRLETACQEEPVAPQASRVLIYRWSGRAAGDVPFDEAGNWR